MWTHLVGMILVIMRGISMQNAEGINTCCSIDFLLKRLDKLGCRDKVDNFIKPCLSISGVSLVKDPFYWPLLSGLVAIFMMYFLSTVAHTFQSRSEIAHYVFFMCDYAGKWISVDD